MPLNSRDRRVETNDDDKLGSPTKKIKGANYTRAPSSNSANLPHLQANDGLHRGDASSTAPSEDASDSSRANRPRKSTRKARSIDVSDPNLELRHKLTSKEGQLEEHPDYTPDEAAQAAKREYNRRNAARARIRLKCVLTEMQEQHAAMSDELRSLKAENAALKAELNEMKLQASTQSLDAESQPRSAITLPQHEQGAYLPHSLGAVGTDRLLQQARILSPQLPMNDPFLQQWASMGPTPTLASNVQPDHELGRQLMQSLMLARARAALNLNNSSTNWEIIIHHSRRVIIKTKFLFLASYCWVIHCQTSCHRICGLPIPTEC